MYIPAFEIMWYSVSSVFLFNILRWHCVKMKENKNKQFRVFWLGWSLVPFIIWGQSLTASHWTRWMTIGSERKDTILTDLGINQEMWHFMHGSFHLACRGVSQNMQGIGNQLKLEPMDIYFSKILTHYHDYVWLDCYRHNLVSKRMIFFCIIANFLLMIFNV